MNDVARIAAPPIRILLAEITGLMAEVVNRAIRPQSDMTIVREIRSSAQLDALVPGEDFDVVVTSVSGPTIPHRYQQLVFECPHVPVIVIKGDEGRAELYDRKLIREVAPRQLVELIREVALPGQNLPKP